MAQQMMDAGKRFCETHLLLTTLSMRIGAWKLLILGEIRNTFFLHTPHSSPWTNDIILFKLIFSHLALIGVCSRTEAQSLDDIPSWSGFWSPSIIILTTNCWQQSKGERTRDIQTVSLMKMPCGGWSILHDQLPATILKSVF